VPFTAIRSNTAPAVLAPHGLKSEIVGSPAEGGYHITTLDGEHRCVVHALMYDVADTAAAAWPDTGDLPARGPCPHCSPDTEKVMTVIGCDPKAESVGRTERDRTDLLI
jgi:hypothetical protein